MFIRAGLILLVISVWGGFFERVWAQSGLAPTSISPQSPSALSSTPPKQTGKPRWVSIPSQEEFSRVFPVEAARHNIGGKAVIHCKVNATGILSDCSVRKEEPEGFGFAEAALALTPNFLLAPKLSDGKPLFDGEIVIPIIFSEPGPFFSGTTLRVCLILPWITAPTDEEILQSYPPAARSSERNGAVVERCRISSEGALTDCQVRARNAPDDHFETAAKMLITRFRAETSMAGKSLVGERVDLSIGFNLSRLRAQDQKRDPVYVNQSQIVSNFTASEGLDAFPKAALKAGVTSGTATLVCRSTQDGRLEACGVGPDPDKFGFGEAALSLTRKVRISLWSPAGESLVGKWVRLQMTLSAAPGPIMDVAPPH